MNDSLIHSLRLYVKLQEFGYFGSEQRDPIEQPNDEPNEPEENDNDGETQESGDTEEASSGDTSESRDSDEDETGEPSEEGDSDQSGDAAGGDPDGSGDDEGDDDSSKSGRPVQSDPASGDSDGSDQGRPDEGSDGSSSGSRGGHEDGDSQDGVSPSSVDEASDGGDEPGDGPDDHEESGTSGGPDSQSGSEQGDDGGDAEASPGSGSGDGSGSDRDSDEPVRGSDSDSAGEASPGEASQSTDNGDGTPGKGGAGGGDNPSDAQADQGEGPSSELDSTSDTAPDPVESAPTPELKFKPLTLDDFDGDLGSAEETERALDNVTGHDEQAADIEATNAAMQEAIDEAIEQGAVFATPSTQIVGLRIFKPGDKVKGALCWNGGLMSFGGRRGNNSIKEPAISVIGPAVNHARVVFADNLRHTRVPNQKAGRINARSLGKRAAVGDPRIFKKKITPNKRDYFVVISMDLSGSTASGNTLDLEKEAIYAQAEVLNRLGVTFCIYGHTGAPEDGTVGSWYSDEGMYHTMYEVKSPHEPWAKSSKEALANLSPGMANLDGHAMEQLRRICDTRTETDRIIMYYTDGEMPAENYNEELMILQREIKECDKRGYTVLGVGIGTDSPTAHGLDTVRVDEEADLIKVVKHLEKRLDR